MLFPPEYGPGVPPACADQTQACEGCQGPSAFADCALARAEVCGAFTKYHCATAPNHRASIVRCLPQRPPRPHARAASQLG
eukprot:9862748-Alexandrium_andersonii.AAC.1